LMHTGIICKKLKVILCEIQWMKNYFYYNSQPHNKTSNITMFKWGIQSKSKTNQHFCLIIQKNIAYKCILRYWKNSTKIYTICFCCKYPN
jgi:hypothetical protein